MDHVSSLYGEKKRIREQYELKKISKLHSDIIR